MQNTKITIIQVYAPTEKANDIIIDTFYEDLNKILQKCKSEVVYVIGDFNAKIGIQKTGEEKIVGEYGYGERNARGEKLITWLWQKGFTVGNTIFKKKEKNK